jgi:hypothetical protein
MSKTLALPQTSIHPTRQDTLMLKRFLPITLFLVFLLGMALIQFAMPDMPDGDFLQVAKEDPGLKEVYRDDQAVIYEVLSR